MEAVLPRVRQNYLANLIAAIACFLIEAGWYSFFLNTWTNGIGRSRESIMNSGVNPAIQYATALVCAFVLATLLSAFIQMTGTQTIFQGVKVAAMAWLGIVVTTWGTEYIFEVRPWSLFGVNMGFWLIGMIVIGAIVGGWKKKQVAA